MIIIIQRGDQLGNTTSDNIYDYTSIKMFVQLIGFSLYVAIKISFFAYYVIMYHDPMNRIHGIWHLWLLRNTVYNNFVLIKGTKF